MDKYMHASIEHPVIKDKVITFIRHGQSLANAGLSLGKDVRLTNDGRKQSAEIAHQAELVILSPLKRTMETYLNSDIKTKRVHMSELFREILDGNNCNYHEHEDHTIESIDNAKERINKALVYLSTFEEKNIVVITHGGFLHHMLILLGKPIDFIHNCQIIKITFIA